MRTEIEKAIDEALDTCRKSAGSPEYKRNDQHFQRLAACIEKLYEAKDALLGDRKP